jgi:hypothetical protein
MIDLQVIVSGVPIAIAALVVVGALVLALWELVEMHR